MKSRQCAFRFPVVDQQQSGIPLTRRKRSGHARVLDQAAACADRQDRLAVPVRVNDELRGLPEIAEGLCRGVATGHRDGVHQYRRHGFQRDFHFDRLAILARHGSQCRADVTRNRALRRQTRVQRHRCGAVDAVRDQDADAPRANASIAGPRKQGQRRRRLNFCFSRLDQKRQGIRQIHAEIRAHFFRKTLIDVAQHRDDALPNGRDLDFRQLEPQRTRDVQLLHRRLAAVEQRRLRIVVGEQFRLAADLIVLNRLRERGEAAHARLEWAAAAERVGLVGNASARDRLTVHAVALIVVNLLHGRIDGNLVEVRASEARDLRVDVRVNAPGEQRIVGEVEPRNDVRRAERHLLGFREEIVGIAVEHHAADRLNGDELFRDDLGGVENIEAEAFRLLLGEDLHAQLVLGKRAGFDRLPQVATMEVGVGAGNFHRLVPVERMRSGTGFQWNLTKRDSPSALTNRKVWTPNPCIIR